MADWKDNDDLPMQAEKTFFSHPIDNLDLWVAYLAVLIFRGSRLDLMWFNLILKLHLNSQES